MPRVSLLLLSALVALCAATGQRFLYQTTIEKDYPFVMRDGVTLYADIYRPDRNVSMKFPVLVERTPYGKDWVSHTDEGVFFPQYGYIVVMQDTRGRYRSEGDFTLFLHDANDGYDTVELAAKLPWSNGNVATIGQSYMGFAQWMTAKTRPPSLKAICIVSGMFDIQRHFMYRNGIFELDFDTKYFNVMSRDNLERTGKGDKYVHLDALIEFPPLVSGILSLNRALSPLYPTSLSPGIFTLSIIHNLVGAVLPGTKEALNTAPLRKFGEIFADGAPIVKDLLSIMDEGEKSPYWKATSLEGHWEEISELPMLQISSWYDGFLGATLESYERLTSIRRAAGKTDTIHQLILGPWGHLLPYTSPTTQGAGDIDFGPHAWREIQQDQLRFMDHYLKGWKSGLDAELNRQPVELFVMGENQWRKEAAWPLPRAKEVRFYIHSDGGASAVSSSGNGKLSREAPTKSNNAPDVFVYNPHDPCPSAGGFGLSPTSLGVQDQREVEKRSDVLVYTSAELESDVEITGHMHAVLYAASNATDTDFTVKLCEVEASGYVRNFGDGIVRARYRESLTQPSLIKGGEVYKYTIDMAATSIVLKKGNHLRVEISSSNHPRFARNSNSGHARLHDDAESDYVPARQQIFSTSAQASYVSLPIVSN